MLSENLKRIQEEISKAAEDCGRDPGSVRLVAVSKTKPIEMVKEAYHLGQIDFGENKVQEMTGKHAEFPEPRWHMIGHLQRNKVKYMAEWVHLIHSVDSERLLSEVSKQAQKAGRVIGCLLQINISDEEQKSGMDEDEARDLLNRLDAYPGVKIEGVMGMAAHTDDEEVIRSQFRRLRNASEDLGQIDHPRVNMREISMGMSHDYKIAIQEGATLVRIGSAVFGSRNY